MTFTEPFANLINRLQRTDNDSIKFIGLGNPNAKILLVSMECAIDRSTETGRTQYHTEQLLNVNQWNYLLTREDDTVNSMPFNPLRPYDGAICIDAEKDVSGRICNRGTTKTWMCYQKITDNIYGRKFHKGEKVDFYEQAFLTELSSVDNKGGLYSAITNHSVHERCNKLLNDEFFRSFPIVILNCGSFAKHYHIDIEEVFDQHFQGTREYDYGWIRVYKKKGRLLLLTKFLAQTNELLIPRLTDIIIRFIEKPLLKYCVYYKGTKKSLKNNILAYYERFWIWDTFLQEKSFDEDIQVMKSFGITTGWMDSFGIPRSLTGIFFNRYMHWAVMGNFHKEYFMRWFKKVRSGNMRK